jgi:hypothetical protein
VQAKNGAAIKKKKASVIYMNAPVPMFIPQQMPLNPQEMATSVQSLPMQSGPKSEPVHENIPVMSQPPHASDVSAPSSMGLPPVPSLTPLIGPVPSRSVVDSKTATIPDRQPSPTFNEHRQDQLPQERTPPNQYNSIHTAAGAPAAIADVSSATAVMANNNSGVYIASPSRSPPLSAAPLSSAPVSPTSISPNGAKNGKPTVIAAPGAVGKSQARNKSERIMELKNEIKSLDDLEKRDQKAQKKSRRACCCCFRSLRSQLLCGFFTVAILITLGVVGYLYFPRSPQFRVTSLRINNETGTDPYTINSQGTNLTVTLDLILDLTIVNENRYGLNVDQIDLSVSPFPTFIT